MHAQWLQLGGKANGSKTVDIDNLVVIYMHASIMGADLEQARMLLALGDQVAQTHFKLSAVVDRLYEAELPTASGFSPSSLRRILRDAHSDPLRTVPEIAALRSVSRQYVQRAVNRLASDGLVELLENPSHKRSKLVQPTALGKQLLQSFASRELPILAQAAEAVAANSGEIRNALALLERLTNHIDGLLAASEDNQG